METSTQIARIRSVREVANFFKANDSKTQLTEWTLRQLIKSGEIPVVRTGKKFLVNLDDVIARFSS